MNKLIPLAAGLLYIAGAQASDVPAPAAEPAAAESTAEVENTGCLQQTGSRIQPTAERPCISGPGQVITREQIERTGAATVADAIRRSSAAVR